MRMLMRRTVGWIVVSLLLAVLLSGCTLSGAGPAPLTPVALPATEEPSPTALLPATPTRAPQMDIFGTQTAIAMTPIAPLGTPGTPGTPGFETPGTTEPRS